MSAAKSGALTQSGMIPHFASLHAGYNLLPGAICARLIAARNRCPLSLERAPFHIEAR
jgi:hypothetical protein